MPPNCEEETDVARELDAIWLLAVPLSNPTDSGGDIRVKLLVVMW